MAILLDEKTEVVVQGATGKEGQFRIQLEIIQRGRECRAIVIVPNSIGLVSPGKAIIGVIGGRFELMQTAFRPGPCGVLSRSGGQTTTLCYYLTKAGVGQSTAIGVGGDAFVGATWSELLPLFERDPETKMLALFGEIGTTNEEDAAALIKAGGFTKPVAAYVSGRYARPGMRFGHAGAIISRGMGTAEGKIAALREAGVHMVEHLGDIGPTARRTLDRL